MFELFLGEMCGERQFSEFLLEDLFRLIGSAMWTLEEIGDGLAKFCPTGMLILSLCRWKFLSLLKLGSFLSDCRFEAPYGHKLMFELIL